MIAFIVSGLGALTWHLITQYFAFQKYKTEITTIDGRTKQCETDIANLTTQFSNSSENLYNKIMLQTAEQDKAILLKVLEQEQRNNENATVWTKVFGEIEKQLQRLNIHLDTQGENITKIFTRVESIEKERLEELRKKIEEYRNNHNNHKNNN